MDQLPHPHRRRWHALTAGVVLALLVLAVAAVFAPHALAQAADSSSAPADAAAQAAGAATQAAADAVEGRWDGIRRVITVILLIVAPIVLGSWLAKTLRMPDHGWKFSIAIFTIAAAAVVVSQGEVKLGPDLSGGITLIYELAEDQSGGAAPATDADEAADEDEAATEDGEGEEAAEGEDAGDRVADNADEEIESDDSDDAPAGAPGPGNSAPSRGDLVASLIEVLSERIDPTGTKEVSIRKYGEGQIEIIIPKAEKQELEYIERRISTAGMLVFRITASNRFDEHRAYINIATDPAQTPTSQDIVKMEGKEVARWVELDDKEFPTIEEANRRGLVTRMAGKIPQALVITDDGLNVSGDHLRSVAPDVDETGKPQVSFAFNSEGAFLFGQLTGEHLPTATNQRYNLGILLDNRLLSAPTIESKITDRGRISGNMSEDEVNFLVGILKAGQLPAALNKVPISRAQISPTLGAQTIEKGRIALVTSIALVALFMMWYYRTAGVIAVVGLAINMLLIVGCMVLIKAAFTLPGLAGLVLTVGMSVDANVLIYERIREELKRGAALRMAIRNGFDRATTTIIDSNVTNLITGIVIYKIAPDNVKGFGITLVLGIAMSIFVAVFLTRIVFDVLERQGWIKTLRMRQFIGETNFDFLGWRRVCIGASLLVIGIGLLAVAARRDDLFDIDFTGGSSVQFVLNDADAMEFDDVLAALRGTALADKNLSLVKVGETNTRYTVTTVMPEVTEVEGILAKAFEGKLKTYEVEIEDVEPIPAQNPVSWTPPPLRSRRGLPSGMPFPLSYAALLQAPAASDAAPADDAAEEATAASDADASTPEAADAANETTESPANETEATPDSATDATSTDAAPSTPATGDATPAAAEAGPFSGGASATILFEGDDEDAETSIGGVSYQTLEQLLHDALKAEGHEGVAFEITNPNYTRGTSHAYDSWQVKLALPDVEARKVLSRIEGSLDFQPLFPLSNKIGARVATRMATDAIAAIVLCLAGIIGYVWFRFHGVMYGFAAVVALIHDVLIALGFVALSAYLVAGAAPLANLLLIDKFQVSLTLVAALLTIIGYSLNDTIVIFDRIREVKGKSPRLTAEMINAAVNQCFARTLLTALTSLISVFVLFIVGGEGIHAFAFALLVGFIAGVYSTIFIANPVLLWLSQRAESTAGRTGAKAA